MSWPIAFVVAVIVVVLGVLGVVDIWRRTAIDAMEKVKEMMEEE